MNKVYQKQKTVTRHELALVPYYTMELDLAQSG